MLFAAILAAGVLQEPPPRGFKTGQAFPDFLLPNVEGGFGRLSDYRGRKVLVLSFASW